MITRIASHHVVDRDGSDSPATITVEAGRISDVSEGIDPKAELVDEWILPGYVDTHCHGGAGADFTDPDREAALRAVHYHRSQGSTTLFASTVTAAIDDVVAQIGRLRQLVDLDEIAGIHLEGPFLAESRKGAHAVELLCDPEPECTLLSAILSVTTPRLVPQSTREQTSSPICSTRCRRSIIESPVRCRQCSLIREWSANSFATASTWPRTSFGWRCRAPARSASPW